jgi:AcrR family transcriptional regulator
MRETQSHFVRPRPPLRQRKKFKTARLIERVAVRLFQQHGFERTTLEQIADAAEVHRQTVLRYYKSKEDIAFAWRNRMYDRFLETLQNRQGGLVEHWRSLVIPYAVEVTRDGRLQRWYAFIGSNPRLYAYELQLNQRFQDLLVAELSDCAGVPEGEDVYALAIAAILVSAINDVFRSTVRSGPEPDITGKISKLVDLAAALNNRKLV